MSNARDKANIPALNFSSSGIDDNATSTAVTIDSLGKVGIGTASPTSALHIQNTLGDKRRLRIAYDGSYYYELWQLGAGGLSFNAVGGLFHIWQNNGSEVMRIRNDGHVGIGTSSPSAKLDVRGSSMLLRNDSGDTDLKVQGSSGRTIIISSNGVNPDATLPNMYTGGSSGKSLFINSGNGANDTVRLNANNATGTVEFKINNSEKMRIISSGNVGIGTSTPSAALDVVGDGSNSLPIKYFRGTSGVPGYLYSDGGGSGIVGGDGILNNTAMYLVTDTRIDFRVNGSERMRITSTGAIRTENNDATDAHNIGVNRQGVIINFVNAGSNPYGPQVYFNNASPDNNTNVFFKCFDNSTDRLVIYSDGDVKNHDNSYGAISDERIKQDIRDSNSQWNDIKAVRVRNFKKKDDVRQYGEDAWEQIGVIAQELETVSPKLIKHSNPSSSDILSDSSFGTLYEEGDEIPEDKKVGDVKEVHQQVKGVSYSVLYMKSIKALQEAMERIETLEAKVQTLENNQP